MRDKLVRCLRMASRLIPPFQTDDHGRWYAGWMTCYGGDTTCQVVSYYGDGLETAIQEVLDSGELNSIRESV